MEHPDPVGPQQPETVSRGVLHATPGRGRLDHHITSQPNNVAILPLQESQISQAGAVISRIESILESILDDIENGARRLSIPYRSRTTTAHSNPPGGEDEQATTGTRLYGVMTFPGRTPQESRKFAALLRILEISRKAIAIGAVITKRNIFYQNTDLFKHQRVVDGLVDDVAFTLGVGRDDLNIVAAAKGLVAGPITLTMRNNSIISCGQSQASGTLIPTPRLIRKIDFGLTEWLLVTEKEATFRTLAAAGYHTKSMAGHGILLTGKGFPDLATRCFLHTIHSVRPHLPMYVLVDYDPDGLSIMRTYQIGSSSLLHEAATIAPQLRWLGIRSDQLLPSTQLTKHSDLIGRSQDTNSNSLTTLPGHFSTTRSVSGSSAAELLDTKRSESAGILSTRQPPSAPQEALAHLTSRDRRMAIGMLQAICQEQNGGGFDGTEQVQELQIMLMLNIKAEIQAVDNLGDISQWLDARLRK